MNAYFVYIMTYRGQVMVIVSALSVLDTPATKSSCPDEV